MVAKVLNDHGLASFWTIPKPGGGHLAPVIGRGSTRLGVLFIELSFSGQVRIILENVTKKAARDAN